MHTSYISRSLIRNRGLRDELTIREIDIDLIDAPVVILGDPGLGKTELTKHLEETLDYVRVPAGTFHRNQNRSRFHIKPSQKLIIDGLDEIASSSGLSAIDTVLGKLSEIGQPNFILSCRSADWQGSTDRHKIKADYGVEPVTLHLQPFSYNDAKRFLESYSASIQASDILDELNRRDLSDFYVNPLTLTLVAEIASAGQGLPKGQAELLHRATDLLTSERNPAHQRSSIARASLNDLLDSAGAIFSHLLLSGSAGVTDRPRGDRPEGFVHAGELSEIADSPCSEAALKSRLFQSPDENLYIPFHRVVAEYLGARWLSKQLSNGVSERRIFQLLSFAGGVPTALRGIHAWLAHFSPNLAARCIRADPYGVLRYGEPEKLPLDKARLLLQSLRSLASEDPYFRSEDWGRRAITGIARTELKEEILTLITAPERHTHLSTLILEGLEGSNLAEVIAPQLLDLLLDEKSAYIERYHAAETLFNSNESIESFLDSTMAARIGAGHEHVPGLYRIRGENRFEQAAGKLALSWLEAYPNAHASVQQELLTIAHDLSDRNQFRILIRDRLATPDILSDEVQKAWLSAAFFSDFAHAERALSEYLRSDPSKIWSVRRMTRSDRPNTRASMSVSQLELIIGVFAEAWPPVPRPSSGWGDTNPWNAVDFIRSRIEALGSIASSEASESLRRLTENPRTKPYHDQLKHVRSQQLRLRRDTEYRVPSFSEVRATLSNFIPSSIDDLKAMTLDKLELIQDYVRNGDTDAWDAFWNDKTPKDENTCRHRLLDYLRARMPAEIAYLPETLMPEAKRADIVAIYQTIGLPIEIKGQWHPDVWDAAVVQLIEKYAKDWRASDRGIYLVLWFGDLPGKNLSRHPRGLPRPTTPTELKEILVNDLPDGERENIDVFVFDVSKPTSN